MTSEDRYVAEMLRAEAELLSSHDSHQVIADRLGISESGLAERGGGVEGHMIDTRRPKPCRAPIWFRPGLSHVRHGVSEA
jgi:hypothetical protein